MVRPGCNWERPHSRLLIQVFLRADPALQSFDRHGLTAEVLARLAPEWASLPTLEGVSHYGQPVKDRSELQRFYQRELDPLRRLTSA